jgi:hypothetical protein
MKNKNITIDNLAIMIRCGFRETAKKADMDQRFNRIDRRLDRIEKLILADPTKKG